MAKIIAQHILNSQKAIQEGTPMHDPATNEVFLYTHSVDAPRASKIKQATPRQAMQLRDSGKCLIQL